MENVRYIELILILGLYYFDRGKNIEDFTIRFNRYFNKDVGIQTILYSISKLKNIDPSNNIGGKSVEDIYRKVWNDYIGKEKIKELKEIYMNFKTGAYISSKLCLDDSLIEKNTINKVPINLIINDHPEAKPTNYSINGISAYKRRKEVVNNALAYANYICEAGCTTELFLRKNGLINYTEAHHIIPLSYQDDFEYSLDVEANVISICPNCHCRLHYGFEIESVLKKIHEMRKNRLNASGIGISYESLLLLYR